MEKMKQLVDLLNDYAYKYYVLDEPVISDSQYDALYDELVALEKKLGVVLPYSPTKKIGGEPVKDFVPHKHINKLYSLDKCNSFDDLRAWDEKNRKAFGGAIDYTLEYKLDGLTLCLTYVDGLLECASTRGNGEVGEDVTAQVATIKSIPSLIEFGEKIEVQGEGIMRWSAFNEFNKTATTPLKNPRNGVAGAIRNIDPKVTASRRLDVIFYNVNYIEGAEIKSQRDCIQFLKDKRFKVYEPFVSSNIEEIIDEIKSVDRQALDFMIDGMVIKVNDYSLREKLGYTDKFPRWAIAYKFDAEETTTKLTDVIWQVGRTGKLTPLGILEPVELNGVTIKKATLNNYDDILRKKVKIGSTVFLRRSNDVIPEILGAVDDNGGKKIEQPSRCPSCNSELYSYGAHLFCPNDCGCAPQICARIEHFASKDCMDIDGISEKTVAQLYEKLNVCHAYMLYDLTEKDLRKLDGFKDKKIANFLNSVEKSKSVDLPRFINALGIENVGKVTARDLAERFGNMDGIKNATKEELLLINEVGEVVADSIIDYFKRFSHVIDKFIERGINPTYKSSAVSGALKNLKFVITGTLSQPRSQVAKTIEENGGIVLSAVSREVDFVVVGENAGSKLDKARKLGKKIIDENELKELLNT